MSLFPYTRNEYFGHRHHVESRKRGPGPVTLTQLLRAINARWTRQSNRDKTSVPPAPFHRLSLTSRHTRAPLRIRILRSSSPPRYLPRGPCSLVAPSVNRGAFELVRANGQGTRVRMGAPWSAWPGAAEGVPAPSLSSSQAIACMDERAWQTRACLTPHPTICHAPLGNQSSEDCSLHTVHYCSMRGAPQ